SAPAVVSAPASARLVVLSSAPALVSVPDASLAARFSSAPAVESVPTRTADVCFTRPPDVVSVPSAACVYPVGDDAGRRLTGRSPLRSWGKDTYDPARVFTRPN